MKEEVRRAKITRTALIFVGPVFGERDFRDSALYDADYAHVLRNRGKKKVKSLADGGDEFIQRGEDAAGRLRRTPDHDDGRPSCRAASSFARAPLPPELRQTRWLTAWSRISAASDFGRGARAADDQLMPGELQRASGGSTIRTRKKQSRRSSNAPRCWRPSASSARAPEGSAPAAAADVVHRLPAVRRFRAPFRAKEDEARGSGPLRCRKRIGGDGGREGMRRVDQQIDARLLDISGETVRAAEAAACAPRRQWATDWPSGRRAR